MQAPKCSASGAMSGGAQLPGIGVVVLVIVVFVAVAVVVLVLEVAVVVLVQVGGTPSMGSPA